MRASGKVPAAASALRGPCRIAGVFIPSADGDGAQLYVSRADWRSLKADRLEKAGRASEAAAAERDAEIADLDEAGRLDPSNAVTHYNRGLARIARQDARGALDDFGQAIRAKPDFPHAYANRGLTRQLLGDIRGAVADLEMALKVAPSDWAHRSTVERRLETARAKAAMKLVLLLVAVALGVTAFVTPVKIGGPAGLVCLFIVLWLLLKMERSPKASDPPAGDPARRRDGAWLALAYRAEGDIDRARAAVERSKTDDPTFEAHAADSAILLTEGNLADAMMAWSEATKLSPSDEDGHFLHLVLYCIWAEIMAHSEEDAGGVELHLRHTPVTRCAILLLDGRPREAMGAVSRGTTDPLEMLACGLALFRVGQVDAARALWAVLVDAMPGKASLSLNRLMR